MINDENQDPNAVTFEDALAADADATPKARRAISTNSTLILPTKASPTKRSVSVAGVPLTPSTPRYRDGLTTTSASRSTSATTPATPVTPSTPRHRVMSAGRLSRRTTPHGMLSARGAGLGGDATPTTPRTPSGSVQTVYHVARQLFARSSGAVAGSLIGREDERLRLRTFLNANCGSDAATTKSDCGCLYVSGPPGTGKSAMVNEMTEQVCGEQSGSVRKAYINCMSIRSSNDLYSTLLRLLVLGSGNDDDSNTNEEQAAAAMGVDLNETDAVNALQAMFLPKASKKATTAKTANTPSTYLVVLDEIDHILTLDLDSLYRVMEWSMLKTSRLVLIGIANALDLTDRFLPRLKSRNLQPELLPFLPYTAPQIKNIITTRLKSALPAATLPSVPEGSAPPAPTPANFLPFFHPAAIELCSRKVASQTGDLRKAFEILRKALDLVESEAREKYLNDARDICNATTTANSMTTPTKKQPLAENMNLASSPPASASSSTLTVPKRSSWASWAAQNLTIETAPRVSIGHLNKVTAAAFGNGAQQRLKGLNLQQKAALCALMAFEKWNRETYAAAQAAAQTHTSLQPPNGVKKLVKAPTPSSRLQTHAAGAGAGGATAAPTIKKLYATYNLMCKRDAVLHPLSSSEFREVVGSLETLSLVTAVDGRTGSFAVLQSAPGSGSGRRGRRPGGAVSNSMMGGGSSGITGVAGDEKRVASCVGEKELRQALDGAGADILQSILSGEALD